MFGIMKLEYFDVDEISPQAEKLGLGSSTSLTHL